MWVGRLLRMILPRSLLGRAILIIVTPLVMLQGIATAIFWENHWDRITGRLVDDLVGDVVTIVDLMRAMPGSGNREILLSAARNMSLAMVLDEDAVLPTELPRAEHSFVERELARKLRESLQRPFHLDLTGAARRVDISIQLHEGVLRVAAPRKRVDSSSARVFTIWMLGSAMLLFGIAMVFMRNQVRSVRRLAAAADSFGKGREVPDFKPEGALEVRQAAMAFNLMRERIRRQIVQRTEMLAGVSHDLRTPLTRMKLQLAMMGEVDGVADLREDVAEMERMIEGYLAFARGEGAEKVRPTDLVALVEDVVGRFRREGRDVDLVADDEIQIPLRPHAFDRCLSNLLSNAARHGNRIQVAARRSDEAVDVIVDDDGPGVPAPMREDVFRAFFRIESSRNPKTGGVGLGLTIARDVIRGHGGDLFLEDSPLGGLRVRIRLPL